MKKYFKLKALHKLGNNSTAHQWADDTCHSGYALLTTTTYCLLFKKNPKEMDKIASDKNQTKSIDLNKWKRKDMEPALIQNI